MIQAISIRNNLLKTRISLHKAIVSGLFFQWRESETRKSIIP